MSHPPQQGLVTVQFGDYTVNLSDGSSITVQQPGAPSYNMTVMGGRPVVQQVPLLNYDESDHDQPVHTQHQQQHPMQPSTSTQQLIQNVQQTLPRVDQVLISQQSLALNRLTASSQRLTNSARRRLIKSLQTTSTTLRGKARVHNRASHEQFIAARDNPGQAHHYRTAARASQQMGNAYQQAAEEFSQAVSTHQQALAITHRPTSTMSQRPTLHSQQPSAFNPPTTRFRFRARAPVAAPRSQKRATRPTQHGYNLRSASRITEITDGEDSKMDVDAAVLVPSNLTPKSEPVIKMESTILATTVKKEPEIKIKLESSVALPVTPPHQATVGVQQEQLTLPPFMTMKRLRAVDDTADEDERPKKRFKADVVLFGPPVPSPGLGLWTQWRARMGPLASCPRK